MNYYERIQQAIEYIESQLQEETSITDIASKAYFSAFHFQRVFQAISGFTVQTYIRKRRLSEAAILLENTEQSVLEIAVAFQYQSQEAFTRAFENCFGLTPGRYRRNPSSVTKQAKIRFLDLQTRRIGDVDMKKPTIIQVDPIPIIGRAYETNLNNDKHFEEIPGFYHDFGVTESYLRIPGQRTPGMSYGIACNFEASGAFTFIVGEEVHKQANELEQGFINFEIPSGKYAEFVAHGPHGLVQDTRNYIYGTWLANANYERTDGPDFEITDVMNSTFPHDLKIKIYIPIK
ncbi:effector binding domain-containing protein [Paenibacillus sp. N3.4]|uniref:AraC family transcriptional regulator n=1 Tax=Paenibacillus sp. N3.4 TaxID=2603222 RepID=UPI0011C8DF0D|nr:effector binding domain-containing protein [Paenibacillus sp. N3.4]TXK74088.1 AraC family transcriptional regulator [Paenibacillus sp. N3.4]